MNTSTELVIVAGVIIAGYLVIRFGLGRFIQVTPPPPALSKVVPNSNPNIPLNLGILTLGSTVTAQNYQGDLESVPIAGNPLADVFTAGYQAGAAVGSALQSIAKLIPPLQL